MGKSIKIEFVYADLTCVAEKEYTTVATLGDLPSWWFSCKTYKDVIGIHEDMESLARAIDAVQGTYWTGIVEE